MKHTTAELKTFQKTNREASKSPQKHLEEPVAMKDVSEESLLDYFCSNGANSGRVKNADILKTFKPFIGHSDLQLRGK